MEKGNWNIKYTPMSVNVIWFRDSNLPVCGEVSTGGELLFRRSTQRIFIGFFDTEERGKTAPEILLFTNQHIIVFRAALLVRTVPGSISDGVTGDFFPWFLPTKPCALRSTLPLKMSTSDFSWDKGGRCIRLTTYHPCSAESRDDPGP